MGFETVLVVQEQPYWLVKGFNLHAVLLWPILLILTATYNNQNVFLPFLGKYNLKNWNCLLVMKN